MEQNRMLNIPNGLLFVAIQPEELLPTERVIGHDIHIIQLCSKYANDSSPVRIKLANEGVAFCQNH